MIPCAASACLMQPAGQIAIIDTELPKAKLTKAQVTEVKALRAKAQDLMAANKNYEATRTAQSALAILGYKPPGPPTRC